MYDSDTHKLQAIARAVKLLTVPGEVYELRCPTETLGTISGYYDDPVKLTAAAALFSGTVPAVYITLNPVKKELLARANNDYVEEARHTTTDNDIIRRTRLLIDTDAIRAAKTSSTDNEHLDALARAREIQLWLTKQGLPEPIYADSGNGGHLVYAIDLPNDDDATTLVSDFLAALHARFSNETVKVDTSVYNASRISKVYGTKVCKGENTPERLHRYSTIGDAPDELLVVPRELLEKIAAEYRRSATNGPRKSETNSNAATESNAGKFDVVAWINKHSLGIKDYGPYKGGTRYVLAKCPFSGSHTDTNDTTGAAIIVREDGRVGFKCHHNSCKGKKWHDVLQHYGEKPKKRSSSSQVVRLISAAQERCVLFTTPEGVAYARVDKYETLKIHSTGYRRWLAGIALAGGYIPSDKVIKDALMALDVYAHQTKETREVYYRLARVENTIYLDLGTPTREIVIVTADGWKVTTDCSIAFVRHDNMAPMPVPVAGGSLDTLRQHINIAADDFPLLRGWLLDCCKGVGPYLVLLFNGEQGSAKSTATDTLRRLIDPVQKAGKRRLTRDEWDLAIAAQSNKVLCFDNVSSIPQWLSDALSALATGSGLGIRTHYQMNEETVFGCAVPILFNGIPDFAESADLLDRCIKVTLPAIPDERRKDEDTLLPAFERDLPGILGGLLDMVATGLRHYQTTRLDKMPRMARSARWITACETGIVADSGFAKVYERNRQELSALALDGSPVANALLAWLDASERCSWIGTASSLHAGLLMHATVPSAFPRNAIRLSGDLRRIAPELRKVGITVEFRRSHGKNLVVINRRIDDHIISTVINTSSTNVPDDS